MSRVLTPAYFGITDRNPIQLDPKIRSLKENTHTTLRHVLQTCVVLFGTFFRLNNQKITYQFKRTYTVIKAVSPKKISKPRTSYLELQTTQKTNPPLCSAQTTSKTICNYSTIPELRSRYSKSWPHTKLHYTNRTAPVQQPFLFERIHNTLPILLLHVSGAICAWVLTCEI